MAGVSRLPKLTQQLDSQHLFVYDLFVPTLTLPLSEMSLAEKLQAMEALWDDLSRNPDALESPAWHEEVLRERQQQIASGEAVFLDWEHTKADIRRRIP